MNFDLDFYKGKKVFVTGHTGFKGSWLCKMLVNAGAIVTGYSLNPPTSPSLYEIAGIEQDVHSVIGDIRDFKTLKAAFDEAQPEIVLHLAAQPIVRDSYKNPAYTYETNVMGTVNILECVRNSSCVKSFLNVTTDKVYLNKEWAWGYRENEELDGYDPYSNSKSCSELVTHSYKNSFFNDDHVAISTARAGNVIGGGDFANDRIIPDCIRAAIKHEDIVVRNPFSTRPYQHVLEPLYAYLMIAAMQYQDIKYAEDNGREKKAIDIITNRGGVQLGLWLFASVIKIIIQYAAVMRCGEGSALILGDRIFTMIQALSVFCLFKKYMDSIHVGRLAKSISRCSFGIYLIHPFFINLLYKMVDITPTNFPLLGIGFAIPLLWFIVFLLSWGATFIMLKIPGLKDLL